MSIGFVIATLCGLFNFSPSAAAPALVKGDYVEARTASVFAGACHYNGELVTTGRDAVLGWKIASGTSAGVDLAGVKAMAVVSCDDNLSDDAAARKSEIVIDSSASSAQASAMERLLRANCGKALGQVVSVRRGPVEFQHTGGDYEVAANGFAALSVAAMPNDECCKQPNLVWYSPLIQLMGRKVGYTCSAAYTAGTLGDCWERSDENSAFYGAFTF
jgi:hypothetical protein